MSTAPVTTFTWAISQLERRTENGEVYTCHYTIEAADGTYRSGAYGSIGLDPADPDSMIAFSDLTEEQCLIWVKEKLGGDEKVAEIEAALQEQLDNQRAPKTATGLPW